MWLGHALADALTSQVLLENLVIKLPPIVVKDCVRVLASETLKILNDSFKCFRGPLGCLVRTCDDPCISTKPIYTRKQVVPVAV